MDEVAIHTSNLTKIYGRIVAVEDINLDVPKGQIIGYLGPNGAGKTTTVKMLVGILNPTSGQASVGGYDVVKDNFQRIVIFRSRLSPGGGGLISALRY